MMRRPWYKPERKPARKHGVIELERQAPVGCPDANRYEIAMALASICKAGNMVVGRGGEYDALKDVYTVVGTIGGKAQDLKIEGVAVAALINELRRWNGRFEKDALTRIVGGL